MFSTNLEMLRHILGQSLFKPFLRVWSRYGLRDLCWSTQLVPVQTYRDSVPKRERKKTKTKTKIPFLDSQGIRVESRYHGSGSSITATNLCFQFLFATAGTFSFCDFRNFKLFHIILPREFNKPKLKETLEHKHLTVQHTSRVVGEGREVDASFPSSLSSRKQVRSAHQVK